MRAAEMIVVMVLLAVQICCSSAATIEATKSTVISKPKCCYKCAGCYDKDNQQRYFALTSVVGAAASGKQAICNPSSKCPVLNGIKTFANNKSLTVKPYNQLTFSGAGPRSYKGGSAVFQRYSSLSLLGSGLALSGGQLSFPNPDSWLDAANGSISLLKSEIKGSLRLFRTSFVSLNQNSSSIVLLNTIVDASYSRWTLLGSLFALAWRAPAAPPGPPFAGSYPFIASYSFIELKNSVLHFENVSDAFFAFSTLQAQNSQVVLINSKVRFLDSVLSLKDVNIKLTNSTLVLNKVEFKGDLYLSYVQGSISGVPKPTSPFTSINKYTFSATANNGTIGLKATTK